MQNTSTVVKGDSTPLNEAPVRWWGGQRGWLDDWDNVVQHHQGTCDPSAAYLSGHGALDGSTSTRFVQPGYGNPLVFREPFARGGSGPGTFLDDEIRESFDGVGVVGAGFADPPAHSSVHGPTGVDASHRMEGIPIPWVVPMPLTSGITRSSIRNESPGYGEVDVELPLVEGGSSMQRMSDNLTCHQSCHLHGNASGFMPDGTVSGCIILVAHAADATLSRRCPSKVRNSDTPDVNTLVGGVVDSAIRRRVRQLRTSRARLDHRSRIHSPNPSCCLRRNRTQVPVLPCPRSVSASRKRSARSDAQEHFGDGGTR